MEISLLETKLNIPPIRPAVVSRSNLFERLQEGLGYNLVLVSAPAGFGKTTLLSEWAQKNQHTRTAWVSLEEGDSDPVRFWDYFIAALQTIQPGFGEKILPWLHSSEIPSTEPMLNALINEISLVKRHSFIVLDDYHLIESPQIHDGITYLIEHLPAQVHLVIATRADPALPLAHFRGKGMMLEIRTSDLRFTEDDTSRLMKELKTPGLSSKDVAALNGRSEGWAVALKIAALSMKGLKDIPGFIATFTGGHRYIMDYLMEEVIRKRSPEVREFLLKTSPLRRLTATLCNSLTGRDDSQEMLLNLERSHLFIVPLDELRQWYRYEHLFADLLQRECETVYGKEQVATLHRQASQWYEENDLSDEAVHHVLAARDWERAVRLVYAGCEKHMKRGEFKTLLGWFRAIPIEILREHLHLYSRYAELLAREGQMDAAEAALGYLESRSEDDTVLQGEVAFSRAIVCNHRGDMEHYLEISEKAFALLPPDNLAMRSRAAQNITHARQRLGHLHETEKWAKQAFELGEQAGNIWVATTALGFLGNVAGYRGELKRAIEMYQKAIEFAGQAGEMFGPRAMLCMVQYVLNDLDAAAETARLANESAERSGRIGVLPVPFYQAQMCLAVGDAAGADAAMKKLDQASRDTSVDSFWYANYIASRVIYAIQLDNLEEAAGWSEQLPDIDGMLPLDWHVPARLLLAQGRKDVAAKLLQELYDKLIQFGTPTFACRIRIYQALAADNGETALKFLAEALTMAEPEGIIRFFVDEGKLLKPLLEKALTQQITPDFTRRILDIIEEEERQRQARKHAVVPSLPGLLSDRELEVVRLLAEDVSNKRIAEHLCVSLSTIKTHVHHIIDKLGVKDRRQAVQRAKDLKLI